VFLEQTKIEKAQHFIMGKVQYCGFPAGFFQKQNKNYLTCLESRVSLMLLILPHIPAKPV